MKKIIQAFICICFVMPGASAYSAGFHYCQGKVIDLVTRATDEGTQVLIEGMNGWARVNFGGDAMAEMHRRQVSMLLAAYMAGKTVQLEFADNTLTCADNHGGMPIRFVRIR